MEEFNKENIDFLMTLYEKETCFASGLGQVVTDLEHTLAVVDHPEYRNDKPLSK